MAHPGQVLRSGEESVEGVLVDGAEGGIVGGEHGERNGGVVEGVLDACGLQCMEESAGCFDASNGPENGYKNAVGNPRQGG